MRRRKFLSRTSGAGVGLLAASTASRAAAVPGPRPSGVKDVGPLTPPPKGKIRVAVAVSNDATVIDFAGPWEVFQDTMIAGRGGSHGEQMPFELFTVAETTEPVRATGGLRLVPDHTFDSAPPPQVVVVPAMRGTRALHEWLRKVSATADITMSVCTGAFQLAKAGLLSGRSATTHHQFLDALAEQFPDVHVERGVRFVDNGKIATAAGLTSGIDMALRVVARYFGEAAAQATADYMEHGSRDWRTAS
jgi:transcriptional regulator GlxA family with amidase domain